MEKKRTNSGPVGESTHKHSIYPRNQLDAKMAFETPILHCPVRGRCAPPHRQVARLEAI